MEVEDLDAVRSPPAALQPSDSSPTSGPPKPAVGQTGASSRPTSNINTFASRFGSSAKKDDDDRDSSDSEEEGQAFYAGGSETSGQQILGPAKNKENKEGADFVKQMFKRAREHGAEAVDPGAMGGPSSSSRSAFTGAGFKLGSTGTTILSF